MKKKIKAVLALKSASEDIGLSDSLVSALQRKFKGVAFSCVAFDPRNIEGIEDTDILFSYVITPELLSRAANLKWFHSVVTGPDIYTFPALAAGGVKVTSPRGAYAVPIAETAMGLMLTFARKIRDAVLLQQKKSWAGKELAAMPVKAFELSGSRVVIVGLGGIGLRLANLCSALGMKVTGVVRSKRKKPSCVDKQVVYTALGKELPQADFVVLACPLTDETRNIIGGRELSLMKRTSYLINIARGALVDEDALLKALREGAIAGAAFDSFKTEPLPDGHPLFSAPNMIVMPHVSGLSDKFWSYAMERFEKNLALFLKGKKLIGEVDFSRGY